MRKALRLCAALAVVAALQGADIRQLQPRGYVSDFAGVVDAASRNRLEQYCAAAERATGAQIAIVTVRSLEGEPIEDAVNNLFRAWGVGKESTDEGIMLLLAVDDRRSRLEVGYGLEPYIPDGFAGSVLRAMRPALREGRYGEALLAAANTIGGRIAAAKGVTIDPAAPRARPRQGAEEVPWPLLLGGGLLLLFLLMQGRGNARYGGGGGGFLPGLILGSMMGRSPWGGRGGGGFGGFDSGDGFGGFGGGDSGGGGASSSW